MNDPINSPEHYTKHPNGIECIDVVGHFNFCLGNVIKYVWRADEKHESPIEDLKRAKWYLEREIAWQELVEEAKKDLERK